jgi:hypothetical protein
MEDGHKRALQTWESYLKRGGRPDGENVVIVTNEQFDTIPTGPLIPRD